MEWRPADGSPGWPGLYLGMNADMSAAPTETKPLAEAPAQKPEPKGFFRFKSELEPTDLEQLCDTLSGAFDIEIALEEAQAAQSRIQDYVASMEGRVGEGVDDLLALWFARRAAALRVLDGRTSKTRPKVNSFEIGALFGGSGGATIMAVDDLKISHKLVVIDPLDGYYGQPVDPVTGASVDPDTLARNFARAGANPDDFEIVQGLSENPEIIARAGRLICASGYIDGDHTLLGIHNDWFEYTPRIQLGGYCIVDNYDDPTSVEVSHFMDHVVLTELADYWTPILKLGQTIVLRKDAEPPLELHRRLASSINLNALRANVRWRDEELSKVSRELGERRKQVQIRNDKIDRLQSDLKLVAVERDLIEEKSRSATTAEYAPKLAELDKTLAQRETELKALRQAQQSDIAALEGSRGKAERLEGELSEQGSRLAAMQSKVETQADRINTLREQVEGFKARREDHRAAMKEASEEVAALRARAGEAASAAQAELEALKSTSHERELELARMNERLAARERELEAARRAESEAEAAASAARKQADEFDRQTRDQDGVIRELQFKVQQAAYEAEQQAEALKALKESGTRADQKAESLREALAEAKDREAELERNRTALDAELDRLKADRDALTAERDALASERDQLAEDGRGAAAQAEAVEAALDELEARYAQLEFARAADWDRAEATARTLEAAEARLATMASEAEEARMHAERLDALVAEGATKLESAEHALAEAYARNQALEESASQTSAELDALTRAAAEAQASVEELGAALSDSRIENADLQKSLAQKSTELGALSRTTAEAEARAAQLDGALSDARAAAQRSEQDTARARERIAMLVKSDDAKAAELNAARAELARTANQRDAAAGRARSLETDLNEASRRASTVKSQAEGAESEAQAVRAHAARLEARLHVMEAQAVSPRVLLRRLAKASAVRSLEIAGGILPGGPGRALSSIALRLRRGGVPQSGSAAAPALAGPAGSGLPATPPTPDMHDAGPPQHDLTFFVNYTFGGKTRYLPRTEFLRHTLRSGRALRSLKGAFSGQRCFVMGNGPSLNHQNLEQLKGEFTIGANYIYMNREKMGFSPTIVSFSNYLVIQQRLDEILSLDESIKTLPFYLFDDFGAPKDTLIVNMQHQTPDFSLDATSFASTQSTVTYVNLQLAYYLGFDEVCLIGCDNRYVQPKHGREGTVLTQEEDDPNHFTPAYFKGLKWQKGDTVRIEQLYAMAGQAFEDRGSKIVDCTYNGALEIFEKKDLDTVVRRKPAPPSALISRAKSVFRDVSRNPAPLEPKTVIVTVSPDLTDKFGHHYNMDAFLRDQAHAAGQELVSLCSISLDRQLADHGNWLAPAFTVKSWHSRLEDAVVARKRRTFESELRKGLSVVMAAFEPGTKFVLYMYTGNLPLGKSLAAVAAEHEGVEAHVHHFYAAMVDMEDAAIVAESTAYIRDIQQLGARLYLGTHSLVSYFKQKTGHKLSYLGDPSVTFDDGEVKGMIEETQGPRDGIAGPARVFFPPNMNVEKGYATVLGAAEAILASDDLKGLFKPVLRYVPRDNTPEKLVNRAQVVKETPGAEVLEGVLSDAEFKSVTLSADIIAITYTVKAFNRRMSGSLTDALMTAKPIVATRGTYVGDQVERFGCGEVFDEGDVAGLIEGLKKIRANYRSYHEAAIAARRKYFKERSWEALHRRLTE